MAVGGWMINLSGKKIPVYNSTLNGSCGTTKLGDILANECFVQGTTPGTGWEGSDNPVIILDLNHKMVEGLYSGEYSDLVDFSDYASNGSSWVKVDTLQRKVQYETIAYDAKGIEFCKLPAGSWVWLTQNCTRGDENKNYCAVTKVQRSDDKEPHTFTGNGFVDLTYGNRWVSVGKILLRKV